MRSPTLDIPHSLTVFVQAYCVVLLLAQCSNLLITFGLFLFATSHPLSQCQRFDMRSPTLDTPQLDCLCSGLLCSLASSTMQQPSLLLITFGLFLFATSHPLSQCQRFDMRSPTLDTPQLDCLCSGLLCSLASSTMQQPTYHFWLVFVCIISPLIPNANYHGYQCNQRMCLVGHALVSISSPQNCFVPSPVL